MSVVYAVEIMRHGAWELWSCYLSKRLAEGVRLRREQEGWTARVRPVTVDWDTGLDQGLPGEPLRCRHCHRPEGDPASCLPGHHHGYVTRGPRESSAEAAANLSTPGGQPGLLPCL